jgi:hypothetical protein
VARVFADENFPLPVVEELRRLGHDIVTITDAGKAGQSLADEALLEFAYADNRAVLTLNRKHFLRLHGAGVSTALPAPTLPAPKRTTWCMWYSRLSPCNRRSSAFIGGCICCFQVQPRGCRLPGCGRRPTRPRHASLIPLRRMRRR